MKLLNIAMALLFLLSAAVQLNDPDPLLWILIYLLAATVCGFYVVSSAHWIVPGAVALLALLWCLVISPGMIQNLDGISLSSLFNFFEMKTLGTELIREFGGLLIVAVWNIVLAVWQFKLRRPA